MRSAAFSPDGAYVVTVSDDFRACVWRWRSWASLSEMLWNATSYCVPVKKRMTLLGESGEEATEAYDKARAEVARRAAAGAYRRDPPHPDAPPNAP
ncbi:MAG: WD40 repeat domain-containing protein [Polyangiales bacterium]